MTIKPFVIDQGAAGTTELWPAVGPLAEIRVINYVVVLNAAGTYAFSDGTDWLSGDLPIAAKGGASAAAVSGEVPLMICGRGRPLSITTTGGSAHGHGLLAIY